MADPSVGDYFITDVDDGVLRDDDMPLVVPAAEKATSGLAAAVTAPAPAGSEALTPDASGPRSAAPPVVAEARRDSPEQAHERAASVGTDPAEEPTAPVATVRVAPAETSREDLLLAALDELMDEDRDIQAAALVSLDGFTMASALPREMQSDRVGAMSAAILALGERASAELGRGQLSQVFIEGEDGYVFLIAAGSWAVLTAIADPSAKLGLIIYDMKKTAERIGHILG